MHAIHLPRLAAATALFLCTFAGTASAEAINGAIYTSTVDHAIVNANHYATKPDVYLNGGPSNAGCNGGSLDDGIYRFQVTDPSGQSLLSSDSIWDRTFQVSNGRIAVNLGTHANGGTSPCGSLAIQLWPFGDTPNNGGVYKVWITRASDFLAACGNDPTNDCGLAGFVPGNTKTDNFKVEDDDDQQQQEELGSVRAFKFYDANANGLYDYSDDGNAANDDPLLDGWAMTLQSLEQAVDFTRFTTGGSALWDDLVAGSDYTVEEGIPVEGNWVHSATIYSGHDGSPVNPAGPLTVDPGTTTSVLFGNYCTVPSNGRTLGFWCNKNGQALLGNDDIAVLIALNLRNANGSHFDPANKGAYKTWLLNGTAVNMAYMLSVQMSAMRMNVLNGFVGGGAIYPAAGMTVDQLIAAANASLGTDGLTTTGHPQRAFQEQLKDWLDQLNNGAAVVSATPCNHSFP
jgi:hypothetical protein